LTPVNAYGYSKLELKIKMSYFNEAKKTNSWNEHEWYAWYEYLKQRAAQEAGHIVSADSLEIEPVPELAEVYQLPYGSENGADKERQLAA
jgi:hypothetical protein